MSSEKRSNSSQLSRKTKVFYWLAVATITFLLAALAVTALVALIASGAFGPALAAGIASAAAAIGITAVVNALATISIAISASVFALTTLGALLGLQETLRPGSLRNSVKRFFKVVNTNTVKHYFQKYNRAERDNTSKSGEDFAPVEGKSDGRFAILKQGLKNTLGYFIFACPPIMMIIASIMYYANKNNFVQLVGMVPIENIYVENSPSFDFPKVMRAMYHLTPVGNLRDITFLRTLLNPVQWLQFTILWAELVSVTFLDSIGQLVQPNPLAALLRGIIYGVLGFTYVLLEPLKNVASIPARVVEKSMDMSLYLWESYVTKNHYQLYEDDLVDSDGDNTYSSDEEENEKESQQHSTSMSTVEKVKNENTTAVNNQNITLRARFKAGINSAIDFMERVLSSQKTPDNSSEYS